MKKKLLYILIIVLSVMIFTGCGTSVNFFSYTDSSGNIYTEVSIAFDTADIETLNLSAQNDGGYLHNDYDFGDELNADWSDGDAWTVEEYIYMLFSLTTSYEFVETAYSGTDTTIMKFLAFTSAEDYDSQDEDDDDSYYKLSILDTFFFYEYTEIFSSPFNGWREEYEAALKLQSSNYFGFFNIMVNGLTMYQYDDNDDVTKTVVLPSVFEAFPASETLFSSSALDAIELSYTTYSSYRYTIVESDDVSGSVSGNYLYGFYYTYITDFSEGDKLFCITYTRFNSSGWITISLFLGFIAMGIVVLIVNMRKKKQLAAEQNAKELEDVFSDETYFNVTCEDAMNVNSENGDVFDTEKIEQGANEPILQDVDKEASDSKL